jgi:hypothetical protein
VLSETAAGETTSWRSDENGGFVQLAEIKTGAEVTQPGRTRGLESTGAVLRQLARALAGLAPASEGGTTA